MKVENKSSNFLEATYFVRLWGNPIKDDEDRGYIERVLGIW